MMGPTGANNMNIGDQIIGSLKKNPEGLLLLAAGAVLLMRKSAPAAPQSQMYQSAEYQSRQASESMKTGLGQQVKDAATSFASTAADYAGQAGQTLGSQSGRVVDSARSTVQTSMTRLLDEQPLMVAAAGLAAGAALAAVFPTTAIERQTFGGVGQQMSDAASRVGEQLKDAAVNAGTSLKDAAMDRGLNADGLKEVVKDATSAFTDSMGGKQDNRAPASDYRAGTFNPATRTQE